MKRRQALINLTLAGAGITLLKACNFGEERVPIALDNLKVTTDQEDLLKRIAGVIIPEGEFPGAISLEADKYVWVMADDCLPEEEQQRFMNGLRGFTSAADVVTGKSFEDLEGEEAASALQEIMTADPQQINLPDEAENGANFEDVKYFLGRTKQWTLFGYMQSEYIMKEVMPYALVPGFYHGCVNIDPNKRVNING